MILGTFAAGAILSLADPDRAMTHPEFRRKLEAVGFGVFIPVFFVTSGVRFDLAALGDNLSMVPLFIGPRWSTYSTKYFHCFASPKNFYGDPIFTTFPDNVLSFTRICPGGQAGT